MKKCLICVVCMLAMNVAGCEESYTWTAGPELCGNGTLDLGEDCDLGLDDLGNNKNTAANGCDFSCHIVKGWSCDNNGCHANCGDGIKDSWEACDDGNSQEGDGCSPACAIENGWECQSNEDGAKSQCNLKCGNGKVDAGEQCDIGSDESGNKNTEGSGCNSCQLEPDKKCDAENCWEACGDGELDANEQCDLGKDENHNTKNIKENGCDACQIVKGWSCSVIEDKTTECNPNCGDGIKENWEACDDGNIDNGDGCSSVCAIEDGWECQSNEDGASSQCNLKCGNGRVDAGEQCDIGSNGSGNKNIAGSGCDNCQLELDKKCDAEKCWEACGDGELDAGEQCDIGSDESGNKNIASSGCNSCQLEPDKKCDAEKCWEACGDGELDAGEQCDLGNDSGNTNNIKENGCDACQIVKGWSCTVVDGKTDKCHVNCGDGVKESWEACDDGDSDDGNGCSSTCMIEDGYECSVNGQKSECRELCGNGRLDSGEECDLGSKNGSEKSGCSDECNVTEGYRCNDSSCVEIRCNDGVLDTGEDCDDGNAKAGDGCSPDCRVEPLFECPNNQCRSKCGDGVWLRDFEACDDGNNINGDGCSSECKIEDNYVCEPLSDNGSIAVEATLRDFRGWNDNNNDMVDINDEKKYELNELITNALLDAQCRKCKNNNSKEAFRINNNTHPDFGYGGNPKNNMLAESLDADGKPVLLNDVSAWNGIVQCKASFDMWYRTNDLFNKEVKLWFKFIKNDNIWNFNYSGVSYYENRGNKMEPIDINCSGRTYCPLRYSGFSNKTGNNDNFTTEIHAFFRYTPDAKFTLNSDDDGWLFVNNKLFLDYGGLHGADSERNDAIASDETKNLTDENNNALEVKYNNKFEMYENGIYPVSIFHAERGSGGDLKIKIPNLLNTSKSVCHLGTPK